MRTTPRPLSSQNQKLLHRNLSPTYEGHSRGLNPHMPQIASTGHLRPNTATHRKYIINNLWYLLYKSLTTKPYFESTRTLQTAMLENLEPEEEIRIRE